MNKSEVTNANIREIEKLATNIGYVCYEAKKSAKERLQSFFEENYKEIDTGCFALSNYIIECDGDLYFLKEWAKEKTRYWGNNEVATVVGLGFVFFPGCIRDYARTTAHRIKLDGTLSAKETELVMVVDGFDDEEAGYLDYHFELDNNSLGVKTWKK